MQEITPFLWFGNQAEEAMNFYISVFPNSRVVTVTRYGETGPGPKGTVMTAAFELNGQKFTALNGGPLFKFNESVSFIVNCDTQEEIDSYWEKLSEGGEKSQCGWLKGQIRTVMAGRARCPGRNVGGQGWLGQSHEGFNANE